MIKDISEKKESLIEIDLKKPGGNAFVLVGIAGNLGKQLGFDSFRIKCIQDEMMLSNYEMLIQTFDKWFGDYVILYR